MITVDKVNKDATCMRTVERMKSTASGKWDGFQRRRGQGTPILGFFISS